LKTTDADVIKFLKMLTFLAIEEIDKLEKSMGLPDYVPNTVQKKLAEEVTRFVHGDDGLQQALNATAALAPGSSTKLDASSLEAAAGDCPSASIAREDVVGTPLPDVMVQVGMQPSKAAVRRMIKGGGVRINNEKVEDELYPVSEQDIIDGRFLLIAAGKKNKMLLKIT
jgi:tyrosyl-tRNA synthetase